MSKNEKLNIKRVLAGAALGAAVTLALSALAVMFLALPVASGVIGEGSERAVVVVCAFLSAAVGALIARIRNKGAALISGAGAALIAVLLRVVIGLCLEGVHALDSADTAVCLAMMCGGMISGAVTMKRRRRHR